VNAKRKNRYFYLLLAKGQTFLTGRDCFEMIEVQDRQIVEEVPTDLRGCFKILVN